MTNAYIHAYRIPNTYFHPHKVIKPFYAKVLYKIVNGKAVIEEVAFHPDCLEYIAGVSQLKKDIQCKLDVIVGNSHVPSAIMNALIPLMPLLKTH